MFGTIFARRKTENNKNKEKMEENKNINEEELKQQDVNATEAESETSTELTRRQTLRLLPAIRLTQKTRKPTRMWLPKKRRKTLWRRLTDR